jgi:DNA-binding GntR family transcriptional regulator
MSTELPKIDPKGPQLVYVVIADHIAARIAAGELKSNERIPGEIEIASIYSVARMTAGRAVKELRERGLVYTVRGKGTFVV